MESLLCGISSTPVSGGRADDFTWSLRQQLEELSARVEELELSTHETDGKVLGLFDKMDQQTEAFGALVAEVNGAVNDQKTWMRVNLASVREELIQNNSLVAELCAKVQSQEEQLGQLMSEREAAPVEVDTGAVTGESRFTRAAKAAAKAAGLS